MLLEHFNLDWATHAVKFFQLNAIYTFPVAIRTVFCSRRYRSAHFSAAACTVPTAVSATFCTVPAAVPIFSGLISSSNLIFFDKVENLDLSGLESNTLNLSSIKSNTSGHSSHESNTLNLSGLESNPPNSSTLELNKPNLFGPELNTLVPDPSEAEELGVESNQSNTPLAEFGLEVDVRYGKNLVYMRKSKAIPELTQVQESDSTPLSEVINSSELQDKMMTQTIDDDLDLPIAIRKGTFKYWKVNYNDVKKEYVKRQHLLDVTEVFRVLNAEKKFRITKLAFYLTMVIITIFRLVLLAVFYLDMDDE
ncbi:unnamed protein product [Vicia faba]|uniref:Transmembrane protein n=1 Tax=Vicia faba TaxID=3906 RepID=A0AAV1AV95_VICFA|nr:unnamed protein product [Vicia faba]